MLKLWNNQEEILILLIFFEKKATILHKHKNKIQILLKVFFTQSLKLSVCLMINSDIEDEGSIKKGVIFTVLFYGAVKLLSSSFVVGGL